MPSGSKGSGKPPETAYRWRGYLMGVVTVQHKGHSHRRVELIDPKDGGSLCGEWSARELSEAGEVATGWPDCGNCLYEAHRQRAA